MTAERRRVNRARTPRAPMEAAEAVRLLRQLEERGIRVWLDGGWGVDALLGEQTRRHDDIDLVATVADSPELIAAAAELGYELASGRPPANYVLLDLAGRQVDVHPVVFDSAGDGIYRMEDGRDWAYPASGFSGVGRIGVHPVRCLTPEAQVLCHNAADYRFDEDDYLDLGALHRRFGVAVPPEVVRWLRTHTG